MSTPDRVLSHVRDERESQDAKWGEQNHPDGTGSIQYRVIADQARAKCNARAKAGALTWRDILQEEVAEAFAEEHEDKLREELIQVAAVAVAWVEAIDRRTS